MKYRRCGENEILVVRGCCHGNPKYITEGSVFCFPGEKLSVLETHPRTINVRCDGVQSTTRQGDIVTFITEIVVTTVIPKEVDMFLEMACELFLDKSDSEIKKIISDATEGCIREVAAETPANDLVQTRAGFINGLKETLASELVNYGVFLEKVTLTHIKFPSDEILNAIRNDVKIGQVAPEDTKVTFY